MVREMNDWNPIEIFAHGTSGITSVGLNANETDRGSRESADSNPLGEGQTTAPMGIARPLAPPVIRWKDGSA
jgi:hypothetical protein